MENFKIAENLYFQLMNSRKEWVIKWFEELIIEWVHEWILMCFPPSKFDLGMEIQQDDTVSYSIMF